jgi:processive 1,2-diacylglycerol beta-glucosyltransferase
VVKKLTRRSKVSFTLLGFTTEMDELMTAADLYVGKPGGLTTSEAMSKGLAMVVINPIPGQEERNSDHLLEEGAAIRCNNLPALAYKIDSLIDRPGKLAQMSENARGLGKPQAAFTVVDKLVELFKSTSSVHVGISKYKTKSGR